MKPSKESKKELVVYSIAVTVHVVLLTSCFFAGWQMLNALAQATEDISNRSMIAFLLLMFMLYLFGKHSFNMICEYSKEIKSEVNR